MGKKNLATPIQTDVASPLESEVRSYSRSWPDTFRTAKGSRIYSREQNYIDFFAAAGSLNYGHNDPDARAALVNYLLSDGILQSLDMQTEARMDFLSALESHVLRPRGLDDYKVMFTGPTGTNAVEAALKCARKATGRTEIVSFLRGFHGVTLGSLAVTSNETKRDGAGVALHDVSRFPYDTTHLDEAESVKWFERVHFEGRVGSSLPAGVLLELVQGEGGINVARNGWASGIAEVCQRYEVPLIVDEIQTGCGRTGPFFAFENYDFVPDIVTVSKSLSGIGLPLSIVLVRKNLDLRKSGQHNGTFRGNNAAFVTAVSCLEKFWSDGNLENQTVEKNRKVMDLLDSQGVTEKYSVRGMGLLCGIDVETGARADSIIETCFKNGLLVESSGANSEVVKIMPALTISTEELTTGLHILCDAVMSS